MSNSTYVIVTAGVFTVVAVAQLARIVLGWSAEIATFGIPMWISYVGLIVTGVLAALGFKLAREARPSA